MKIIGPATPEDVEKVAPGLLDALGADRSEVSYCQWCDGLRTHTSAECPNQRSSTGPSGE